MQSDLGGRHYATAMLTAVGVATIAGLIALIVYAGPKHVIGILLLYSAAFFACGSFLGFLFGIPRTLPAAQKQKQTSGTGAPALGANSNPPSDSDDDQRYSTNTNLEEISDWLTKIIVGLGLVNLTKAPQQLKAAAWFFANFCNDRSCESVLIAVMLYFAICGFFLLYLMDRVYFPYVFSAADREANRRVAAAVSSIGKYGIGKALSSVSLLAATRPVASAADFATADPNKGRFGGLAEANERVLRASVTQVPNTEYFSIHAEVVSTAPKNRPLADGTTVIFHLHPTFARNIVPVSAVNGRAAIDVVAWGAFTIGVEVEDTRLELDLAELSDAPALFRSR